LKNDHPDVTAKCSDVKFLDARGRKGQRNTPACDVQTICEIIFLLPGRHAARVRRQAAEVLCRYLGGDLNLYVEGHAIFPIGNGESAKPGARILPQKRNTPEYVNTRIYAFYRKNEAYLNN